METIYRKVYTKDRLPGKEGVYYVEMNKGCCGLHEIHFWGHYHNRKDGKAQVRYWQNTFDWWLEEVELPDVNSIHDYAFEHRSDFTDSSEFYGFELGADFMRDFIKGKVQLNQTKDTKLTL